MDRREFFKLFGLGALALALYPVVKSIPVEAKQTVQEYLDNPKKGLLNIKPPNFFTATYGAWATQKLKKAGVEGYSVSYDECRDYTVDGNGHVSFKYVAYDTEGHVRFESSGGLYWLPEYFHIPEDGLEALIDEERVIAVQKLIAKSYS